MNVRYLFLILTMGMSIKVMALGSNKSYLIQNILAKHKDNPEEACRCIASPGSTDAALAHLKRRGWAEDKKILKDICALCSARYQQIIQSGKDEVLSDLGFWGNMTTGRCSGITVASAQRVLNACSGE